MINCFSIISNLKSMSNWKVLNKQSELCQIYFINSMLNVFFTIKTYIKIQKIYTINNFLTPIFSYFDDFSCYISIAAILKNKSSCFRNHASKWWLREGTGTNKLVAQQSKAKHSTVQCSAVQCRVVIRVQVRFTRFIWRSILLF